MRKTLIFLTIVFWVFHLHAQTDWCGFSGTLDSARKDTAKFEAFRRYFATGLNQFRYQQGPFHISNPPSPCFSCFTTGSSCVKATYILPIVVHVIHLQGDTVIGKGSNISIAQIKNAIERLNEAFRNAGNSPSPAVNTGIQFYLANIDYNGDTFSGIERIKSNTLSNWKTNQLSSLTALGQYYTADKYINVYVVNRILDPAGNYRGVLGKSTFPFNASPDIQGVIIAHDFFGDYRTIGSPLDTNSLGLVFPHEIGHYLGLYHPFDFSCTGVTDKDCSTDGDLCCDVPAVDGKNQNCSINWNTCKNESYYGFDPDDQKENYMDYSNEYCKTTFTEDQTGLMHYTLERFRPGLIDPTLTNKLQMKCCLYSALFNGEDFGCDNDPISMIAIKYTNSVTYRWQFFKGNTVKYTFIRNSEKLTNISLDTGIYTVKLTVTDGTDSVTWSRKKWLKIADCSTKLKSTSSNWFFGVQAGVKFYKSGVFRDIEYQRQEKNLFNHQPDPGEGTLSVSDTGNLLFYGGNDNNFGSENYMDSFRIYDSNYNHMQGSPIVAWNNATQPIVCINIPDSTKKYYVISNINTRLNLNVIDLNKTSVTFGEITRKHVPILLPSWLAGNDTRHLEALTAIQHCDGKNYWLLSHAKHNDTPMILVFKVINTGISYNGRILTPAWRSQSTMKFSPNGRWLSIENALYLFDRKNGTAELYKNHVNANSDAFSAAFSPNSNYLYRYERNFVSPFNTPLYQYDLTSTDNYLSRQNVTEVYGDLSLQNGPDSSIYFANFASQDFLSAIVKPNEKLNGADNACLYIPDHVKLNSGGIGGYAQTGLPQFVNALPSNKVIPDFIATIEKCKTVRFIVNQCCIANKITWEFGDGYFGTGLDTIHIYSTTGNYSIKMKWGNDSVIHNVLLGINPSDLSILGDTSICDTAKTIYYQTPKYKSDYLYKWDARTDGTSSNDAEYKLNSTEVKWKRSGYLYLAVFDNRTGCQDSAKIHISANNSILNNHIDSNQFVCDTTHINQLIGSTPTGGTGTYAYQWYYRQNGSNTWKFATGLTSKNAIPIKKDSSFQYYREVTSGTCLSKSNVIHVNIASDYSALEKGGTCKGKIYVKNRPLSSLSGYSIQWQESFDSVTWINITGATGDTLTVNNTILRKWFRQKLSKGVCVVYSPRIQKGDLTITTQPTDAVSCGAIPFNIRTKAQSTVGFNIKYSWQYLTNDNNWKSLVGNSNDSLVQQVNWPNYRTFNCKITSYCGTQNSQNATVGAYSAPFVIYTNHDTTVSSNSSVTFNGKWSGERNTCYVVWQKSRCPFGCQWDSIGKTSNNTFTTTPNFNDCQRKTYYRFTLRNLCPIDTIRAKKFWNNKYTSKTFEAGSYQLPNYHADLWIPDTYRDTGLEPNMVDINAYTVSTPFFKLG